MHFVAILSCFMLIAPISRAVEFNANNAVNATRVAVVTSGEILFGGLFPVHSGMGTNITKQCTHLNHERGIHRLEAMMYAVDMINKNDSILPYHTIGVNIRDTCGVDTHALEESIHFIRGYGDSGGQCGSSGTQSTIFGVIGAASSGVSIQVANLLRLFQIPQISYASTSPDLNDRQKYDYFLRTVPPDTYQARAMVDVIHHFKWTSVHGLYSAGNYGRKGMEMFQKLAKASGICMVTNFIVNSDTIFSNIVDTIANYQTTRVVVLYLSTEHLAMLLRAVQTKLDTAGVEDKSKYRFKWLASDYWGTRSQFIKDGNLGDAAQGAITLTLQTVKVQGFENYFRNLTPENNKRNPWFTAFWEEYHRCSLSNKSHLSMPQCSGNETLRNSERFDDKVPYVVDAVYALAYAVHDMIKRYCTGADCTLSSLTGQTLLHVLQRNLSFTGQLGFLKFDENGSTVREYEIHEFVSRPSIQYKRLGSWFHKLTEIKSTTNVTSSCSDTCRRGQFKMPGRYVTCCFTCQDCGPKQYVEGGLRCKGCTFGEKPNATRTGCLPLPEEPISSTWVITMMTLSSFGVVTTFLVILIFLYHNSTAVVKASGRELSYPLLIGIIFCYALPFVLLSEPTTITCGVARFGFGFSFFVCYASLVTKTNRIERVFKRHTSVRTEKLSLVGPSSQVLILIVAVLFEALLAIIGLFIEAANVDVKIDEARGQKFKICVFPSYDVIVAFACNMILIIMCTVFAFRTRKVPDCFNEAKYIGFVMYTTCVLWIAFVTIYIGVNLNYLIIAICMNIFLSATSILAGVFGPKVYIIIFRPGRNIRSRSGLSIRHVYSNQSFAADPPMTSRKMTTLTEVDIEVATPREGTT